MAEKMSDIFPLPDDVNMPPRIWETYQIMVGVCNSLNAQSGRFRYDDCCLSCQLLKAQEVIMVLLYESGRIEEYEDWERKVDKW